MKKKVKYTKPKIKSSIIDMIHFYGNGNLRNPTNAQYLIARIC